MNATTRWVSASDLVPTVLAPAQYRRLVAGARFAVPIGTRGQTIRVWFNDAEAAECLAQRYRALPGSGDGLDAYAVTDRDSSYFWAGEGTAFAWHGGPLRAAVVAFFADAIAMDALLGSLPSTVTMHAAALGRPGRAFGIAGTSTAGKSTTALACIAIGCGIYSDERCLVAGETVEPFPRALNLRAGGIALLLEELPEGALRRSLARRRGADWDGATLPELGAVTPPPAPLHALFAIAGRADAPASRRITPIEMVPHVRGALSGQRGIDRFGDLLAVLHRTRCYALTLGSPVATARHIVARVDGCIA